MLRTSSSSLAINDEIDLSIDLTQHTLAPPNPLKHRATFMFTFYTVTVIPRTWPIRIIFGKRNWWDEIVPGVLLGAIPLKDWGHLEALLKLERPLKRVISCCTHSELKGEGLAHTPVSPFEWHENEISQDHLNMKDFTGDIPQQDEGSSATDETHQSLKYIYQAVLNIQKTLDEGFSTYTHCKAGRGRSVLVIACYLIYFYDMPPNEAIAFIRQKRAEISLSQPQIELIYAFCKNYKPELLAHHNEQSLIAYKPPIPYGFQFSIWDMLMRYLFKTPSQTPLPESFTLSLEDFVVIHPEILRRMQKIPSPPKPFSAGAPLALTIRSNPEPLLLTYPRSEHEEADSHQEDAELIESLERLTLAETEDLSSMRQKTHL